MVFVSTTVPSLLENAEASTLSAPPFTTMVLPATRVIPALVLPELMPVKSRSPEPFLVIAPTAAAPVSVIVLDRVEFRFWLSPIVSAAPLLILTVLLLPTLLSEATVLLALMAKIAAAGFVLVSASVIFGFVAKQLAVASVSVPESI